MLRVEISTQGNYYEAALRRRILGVIADFAEEKQITVNYVKFIKPRSK